MRAVEGYCSHLCVWRCYFLVLFLFCCFLPYQSIRWCTRHHPFNYAGRVNLSLCLLVLACSCWFGFCFCFFFGFLFGSFDWHGILSRPRGAVGIAALLCRWQTAGGGSIPCWSASKTQDRRLAERQRARTKKISGTAFLVHPCLKMEHNYQLL